MTGHRKHHQVSVIVAGTGVLLGLDMLAWALWVAWNLLPWLLAIVVVVVACRRWQLVRRVWAWLRDARTPGVPPRIVQGHVIDQATDLDRAELTRLRNDNSALKTKVKVLSDMLTDPEARP